MTLTCKCSRPRRKGAPLCVPGLAPACSPCFTAVCLFVFASLLTGFAAPARAAIKADARPCLDPPTIHNQNTFFILRDGTDLKAMGGKTTRRLLQLVRTKGRHHFGKAERKAYCRLKHAQDIQWVLSDLKTGRVVSESARPDLTFFGASASKLFVAAALLDKQNGHPTPEQLKRMAKMIGYSSNPAWLWLQKACGDGSCADRGREAIDRFTRKMGYARTRGFQGWWRKRVHGNELNARDLSRFLHDTCHQKYPGAEILWKLMYTCRTGGKKGNRYLPKGIFVGGKTGTYSGPNASPETVPWPRIRARNHVMVFSLNGRPYGLAILSNRGNDRDVALVAGGLVREFLLPDQPLRCPNEPINESFRSVATERRKCNAKEDGCVVPSSVPGGNVPSRSERGAEHATLDKPGPVRGLFQHL